MKYLNLVQIKRFLGIGLRNPIGITSRVEFDEFANALVRYGDAPLGFNLPAESPRKTENARQAIYS